MIWDLMEKNRSDPELPNAEDARGNLGNSPSTVFQQELPTLRH